MPATKRTQDPEPAAPAGMPSPEDQAKMQAVATACILA